MDIFNLENCGYLWKFSSYTPACEGFLPGKLCKLCHSSFFRYLLALAQSCGSDLINTCSMFVLLKFTHFGWG